VAPAGRDHDGQTYTQTDQPHTQTDPFPVDRSYDP